MKETKMFFGRKVDLRSREDMIDYLVNHFRYNTMNHWNRCTSYANNVKIHTLQIPRDLYEHAWELLEESWVYAEIEQLLYSWAWDLDFSYQVGFNGRSGGYLVLYNGSYEIGTRSDGVTTFFKPVTQIGVGIDEDEECFYEWDIESIRERVRLVQSFDRICDRCRELFISFL